MKQAIIVAAIVIAAGILSNTLDHNALSTAECVRAQAIEQGYAGDINSAEAWGLFINNCN